MAIIVEEIMNRELFSARPGELAADALGYIQALGISASPVIDAEGRLVGMVSLRDLMRAGPHEVVRDRMSSPVATVRARAPIEQAARLLADTGYHRLVALDEQGRPVGVVSALDVVRGLIGLPARHPPVFPHYDKATGVTWTDDTVLEFDHVEAAPDAAGVLVLIRGGVGVTEQPVWAESCDNVRKRLIDILSSPQDAMPTLTYWLQRAKLRFRAAALPEPELREQVLQHVREAAGQV